MEAILGVAGMFLLRVGLPIILLVFLGATVDRWQKRRDEQLKAAYAPSHDTVIAGYAEPQATAQPTGDVRTGTDG